MEGDRSSRNVGEPAGVRFMRWGAVLISALRCEEDPGWLVVVGCHNDGEEDTKLVQTPPPLPTNPSPPRDTSVVWQF